MSEGMASTLGDAIASELAAMNNSGAKFEAELQATRDKQKEMMESVFASMSRKKEQPMHPDTVRIARMLDGNPALRIAVEKFLGQKLAELSAATSTILGVTPEETAKR